MRTHAARITQLSIAHQLEEYCRRYDLTLRVTRTGPAGPLRYLVDGQELSTGEAADRYLGGHDVALGRSADDWTEFLAGPWCLSPAALTFRDAWQAWSAAADTAAAAAIVAIADHVRRVYPHATSISCASFRNGDGHDVLRLRGVFDGAGLRVAAIDDDEITYASGWPVGGNEADAEELAYERVDPILSALVELDPTYTGDQIHTIALPTPDRGRRGGDGHAA